MTLKNRLEKLERGFRIFDGPCPNHRHTVLVKDDEPMPEKAAIPLCPNCGKPGTVLVIHEVIINSREDIERHTQT